MEDVYIVGGVRTAIGAFGGALAEMRPAETGSIVIREAISRAGLEPQQVQHVVMGNVIPTQPADAYLARVAAIEAGIPVECPAMTVNRLCGSGLQAIISVAQMLRLGECAIGIGAGAESMSNAPHHLLKGRFGQKMDDIALHDALLGTLHDPFDHVHMGVTAENIAREYEVSREAQDALALESHRRAARATEKGYFNKQIVPIAVSGRKGTRTFNIDEHIRYDAAMVDLANLRPVFEKDGTVTAGNASGINDGAAAVVLAAKGAVQQFGLTPMAKIIGWGYAGVEPSLMGLGPVKAVPKALQAAGLNLEDIDVIESNEAFAAQACGVANLLGFDPAITNPNGSGISLGHPVGATGAVLTVKAVYELLRISGRYGLVTMCIGGGQGIAMVIEAV